MKKKINNIQIHQFTPSMALGDSVSSAVLYIQSILIEFGFTSNIYVSRNDLDRNFKHNICHIEEYTQNENNVLLYHHSIGHNAHEKIMRFKDKKILIYHNITPPHFFKNNTYIQNLCIQGRVQLSSSAKYFISAIGDSHYNCKELRYYNYKKPKTLTLLLDWDKQKKVIPNQERIKKYYDLYNIIFVGRVVQNKAQHQLIDVAYALKKKGLENFKIHIIGGASDHKYMQALQQYAKNLDILVEVTITGKVSQENLKAYYTLADLYLSLSEHEGFGMPLVEAMRHDIPVLSYDTGGVSSALPKESLLEKKSPNFIANKILKLQKDPYHRVELIKKQREKLESFSSQNIKEKFAQYLNDTINTNIKYKAKKKLTQEINYQIQGPFDSSYSLAIVNKTVANALHKYLKNTKVKLYSTEGAGDFIPNLKYLDDTTKKLALISQENIDISIRNLYPPRTNAMKGYHKILGPFGWEESKFPKEYIHWFNTKLTMIFAVSNYVKDLLKHNGVYTPIYTTGNIVEDIIKIKSQPLKYPLPDGFKLLHISSAFPRKGIDILLTAFDTLIDRKISLILKTFPNPHNDVLKQLDSLSYTIKKEYEKDVNLYIKDEKQILLINKDISQEHLKYLYENSDILIAPSFGEGFGLPLAEAMLLNLPVITTAYGGQCDFCTEKTASLIDFDFTYAKSHLSLTNSIWAIPKISSLQEKIITLKKELEKNSPFIVSQKQKAKEFIKQNYSAKKIAKKIEKYIENYPKHKSSRNIALFSTYNTKCGIAFYSKHLISSFKNKVTIFANNTNEKITLDDENIIRCWDASRNTPNIIALKKALKRKKIDTLIIQYNFSFIPLHLLSELLLFCENEKIETHLFLHSTQDVITPSYTDSFYSIKKAMNKANKIYVHTLKDLNHLKNLDIYKNTFLATHGINTQINKKSIQKNSIPVLATFGFLLPHKGFLELVDVVQSLHNDGIKVRLLLLTSLHPANISKILYKQLKEKIRNTNISEYITLNTDFLEEEKIVSKLSQADKILFIYQNTQESSSAAVRTGLLAQKEVITTPLDIFEDLSQVVTQTKDTSVKEIVKSVKKSLKTPYDTKTHQQFLEQNSWEKVSQTFYNSINSI